MLLKSSLAVVIAAAASSALPQPGLFDAVASTKQAVLYDALNLLHATAFCSSHNGVEDVTKTSTPTAFSTSTVFSTSTATITGSEAFSLRTKKGGGLSGFLRAFQLRPRLPLRKPQLSQLRRLRLFERPQPLFVPFPVTATETALPVKIMATGTVYPDPDVTTRTTTTYPFAPTQTIYRQGCPTAYVQVTYGNAPGSDLGENAALADVNACIDYCEGNFGTSPDYWGFVSVFPMTGQYGCWCKSKFAGAAYRYGGSQILYVKGTCAELRPQWAWASTSNFYCTDTTLYIHPLQ
ncbi:hypothetical protein JCM8547_003816 [Rhodosporidiobolus lusitaniae]